MDRRSQLTASSVSPMDDETLRSFKGMSPKNQRIVENFVANQAASTEELAMNLGRISISRSPAPAAAAAFDRLETPPSSPIEKAKGKRKASMKHLRAEVGPNVTAPVGNVGSRKPPRRIGAEEHVIPCKACMEDGASCKFGPVSDDNLPPCDRCKAKDQKCQLLYYLTESETPLIHSTEVNNLQMAFCEGWAALDASFDRITDVFKEIANTDEKLHASLARFQAIYVKWREMYEFYLAHRDHTAEYSAGEYIINGLRVIFEEPQEEEVHGSVSSTIDDVEEINNAAEGDTEEDPIVISE